MVVGLAVGAGPPGTGHVDERDVGAIIVDAIALAGAELPEGATVEREEELMADIIMFEGVLDPALTEEVDMDVIIDGEKPPTVDATAEEVDAGPAVVDEGGTISIRIAPQTSIFGVMAPRLVLG